jgi:hypothetical protein
MKRLSAIVMALLFVGVAALWHDASGQTGPGWINLFDGKNLDNWNQIGNANWRLEDGLVVADKGSGHLVSKNDYADFELRAEFWVDATANSGIFIRAIDPNKIGSASGYEVNIYDERPDQAYGTGAIPNVAKVEPMPKAGNRWNVYEIVAKGPRFTVTLNGQRTVDGAQDSKFAKGRISLQYGKGIVKFRKVDIKPL